MQWHTDHGRVLEICNSIQITVQYCKYIHNWTKFALKVQPSVMWCCSVVLKDLYILKEMAASMFMTGVFLCFVLSCKANARVKLAKTWHGLHSSKLVVICVVLLLFELFYVLFVCKCILYYCHRVSTQLQLTNISTGELRGHGWYMI